MEHFKCCYCKEIKPSSQFFRDRQKKSGYRPRCIVCEKLYVDRDNRSKYEKKYWDKRRKHRRKIVLKSYYKNKEHHQQKRKEYLRTDIGINKHRHYGYKRRLNIKYAEIEKVDLAALYEESNKRCFYCEVDLLIGEVDFDHYIPISRGGLHTKDNLRISCNKCNRSKGNRMPEEWEAPYQLV